MTSDAAASPLTETLEMKEEGLMQPPSIPYQPSCYSNGLHRKSPPSMERSLSQSESGATRSPWGTLGQATSQMAEPAHTTSAGSFYATGNVWEGGGAAAAAYQLPQEETAAASAYSAPAASPYVSDAPAAFQVTRGPSATYEDVTAPTLDALGNRRGQLGDSSARRLHLPGLPSSGDRSLPGGLPDQFVAADPNPQPPLRPMRTHYTGDKDDRCEICWENDSSAVNPIIECQGCALLVHQQCYGVCQPDNGTPWYCAVCLYWRQMGVSPWNPKDADANQAAPPVLTCSLCNRPNGALKCGTEGVWVHVGCVLYSQEGPSFRNLAARSAPIHIQKSLVAHTRQRFSCSICRRCDGYTTRCLFPGCLKRVHVACVFDRGLKPKLQMISAEVPVAVHPLYSQMPTAAHGDTAKTRTVEKLLRIVTCETHCSANAYNAIEQYEKNQLPKSELAQSTGPPETYGGSGLHQRAAVMPDGGASRLQAAPGQQWAAASGYSAPYGGGAQTPNSSAGYFYPPHYGPMVPPYFNPAVNWMSGYGFSAAYGRVGPYAPPFGPGANFWPGYGMASGMMAGNRHPTGGYSRTAAGGPRIRTGMQQQSGMKPMEKEAPPQSKVELVSPVRPKKKQTSNKSKTEATSPVAQGVNKFLKSTSQQNASSRVHKAQQLKKKKSGRTTCATSLGGVLKQNTATTGHSKVKSTTSAGRRKADDEDEYTGPGGSSTATRAFKVNWSKLDSHFRSFRAKPDDPLVAFVNQTQDDLQKVDHIFAWSWLADNELQPPPKAVNTNNEHISLEQLREIWLSQAGPATVEPAAAKTDLYSAPVTVLISTQIQLEREGHETSRDTWTFWKAARPATTDLALSQTPTRVTQRDDQGEQLKFGELSVSMSSSRRYDEEENSNRNSDKENSLELLGALKLSPGQADLLRSNACNVKATDVRSCAGERRNLGGSNGKVVGEVASSVPACVSRTRASASKLFVEIVERSVGGQEEPTKPSFLGACSSEENLRRRTAVDLSSWAELLKLESVLGKKQNLPSFFIMLKKMPPELINAARSSGGTTLSAAVQKYLSNRDSITLVLEAQSLRRTASTTKKLYLHGHFWDLNPPVPQAEERMRALLPPKSFNVLSLPSLPTEPGLIPIADETTRDWLTSAQRVRQQRQAPPHQPNAPHITAEDFQKAIRGEELVRILASEEYWKTLLFEDDFSRRQAVSHFMLWAKRRSRLVRLLSKISGIVQQEASADEICINEPRTMDTLKRHTEHVSRWTALRAAFQAGHQDPSSSLVTRVKTEHDRIAAEATKEGDSVGTSASRLFFCLVCFGTELDNLNPLVTCARCGIKVHKNCYAIGHAAQLELDTLEWYCERCESEKKVFNEFRPHTCVCAICLQSGGALKKLSGSTLPRAFVHVTCAVWSWPRIQCRNLFRLTEWVSIPDAAKEDGEEACAATCFLCAKALLISLDESKRASQSRRRGKIILEDDDEMASDNPETPRSKTMMEMTPDEVVQLASPYVDDTAAPDIPWGRRGLPCRCAAPDCNVHFHALCAWLAGYRVCTEVDYSNNVSMEADLFCPAMLVKCFCEQHTLEMADPERLPLEVVAEHRHRAYIVKDGVLPQVLPTVPISQPTAAVLNGSLPSPSKRAPPESGDTVIDTAIAEPTCRRPSIPAESGLQASAEPVAPTDVSVQPTPTSLTTEESACMELSADLHCTTHLSESDTYAPTACQVCLSLSTDGSELSVCKACHATRAHSSCSVSQGRRLFSDEGICVSCESGGSQTCYLCPRLGGALVAVKNVHAHKLCLGRLSDESESVTQECSFCGVASGLLQRCAASNCDQRLHPLCGALATSSQASSSLLQPPQKVRKLTATAQSSDSAALPLMCKLHAEGDDSLLQIKALLDEAEGQLDDLPLEALRETAAKYKECIEKHLIPEAACGITKPDVAYGISYEHTQMVMELLDKKLPAGARPPKSPPSGTLLQVAEVVKSSQEAKSDCCVACSSPAASSPVVEDVVTKKSISSSQQQAEPSGRARESAAQSKEGAPPRRTPTSSELGRRKRKRTVVAAESDSEASSKKPPPPSPPPAAAKKEEQQRSSKRQKTSSPATSVNPQRKKGGLARPDHKPVRNEKGQFVKSSSKSARSHR